MKVFLRPIWFVAILAHGVGAAAWWWLMAGGFPFTHPRFWLNRAAPAAIVALAAVAIIAWPARRVGLVRSALAALACMWLAATASAHVAYPLSSLPLCLCLFGVGGLTAGAAMAVRPPARPWSRWNWLGLGAGLAMGVMMPWALLASTPTTRPLNPPLTAPPTVSLADRATLISLNDTLNVQTAEGVVALRSRHYQAYVEPLLTFGSRSPDRCWTILAPDEVTAGHARHRYAGVARDGEGLIMAFTDDALNVLRVQPHNGQRAAAIDALSHLPEPVYSHLNSFCVVSLTGHRRASVSFSPCPETRINVHFADYPFGRPSRAAFLTANGTFCVVEASSGEKGPYRTLATGRLARSEPLIVTFYDGDRPVLRAVLDDWASQASTALSPTAGWGLPVNAIEFGLENDYSESAVNMFFTLAATSLGLGWDSVGHAAGTYRNRVWVELLE